MTTDTVSVMLCDDHAVVLAGLERLIATFDRVRVVATCRDGLAAVAAAALHRPDVILMDLEMPGLDGIETTRRVRDVSPDSAIVILTSFSDSPRIRRALEAGAIGYQLKDINPDELERAIHAAARGEAPLSPRAALALVKPDELPTEVLSERELEIVGHVAAGLPNKAIARKLGITEATVKAHLTAAFRRIGVENRTSAARWYERRNGGES